MPFLNKNLNAIPTYLVDLSGNPLVGTNGTVRTFGTITGPFTGTPFTSVAGTTFTNNDTQSDIGVLAVGSYMRDNGANQWRNMIGDASGQFVQLKGPGGGPAYILSNDTDGNGAFVQGIVSNAMNRVFNGTSWDRARDANSAHNGTGTGLNAVGTLGWNGSAYIRDVSNGSGHKIVSLGVQTGITDVPSGQLALTVPATGGASTLGVLGFVYDGVQQRYMRGDISGVFVHAPTNAPDTSLSGSIAASGGTASVAFVSTARQEVINSSTGTLWARWGAAPAVNGAGSFPIAAGGSYSTDRTNGTLQLLSTAANQTYTVNRFA